MCMFVSDLNIKRKNKMRKLKIKEYAEEVGVTSRTIWNWVKANKLPEGVSSEQLPSGTWRITIAETNLNQ